MGYGVLGPVESRIDGRPLRLPGRNRPTLLATLLLHNRQVVSIERLISTLWDENPPSTARRQTQNMAASLRRDLRAAGEADTLDSLLGGYRINVDAARLDLARFDHMAGEARRHVEAGRDREAVACFESSLAEWRGPALFGLRGHVMRAAALHLDERRLGVVGELLEARLRLGLCHEVIAPARAVIAEHPFREATIGQLMRALQGVGRIVEALRMYAELRVRLVRELGIDPCPALQLVHRRILRQFTAERPA